MIEAAIIGAGAAVLVVAAWHEWFVRVNRRRAVAVLRWLQSAIANYGQLCSVTWVDSARLRIRLELHGHAFRQPTLEVRLAPRHSPLRWALWRLHRRPETLIFQANLALAPVESMEISRMRWSICGRGRIAPGSSPRIAVSTLYISSQPAWQPQSSGSIHAVVAARDFQFLAVSFRPCHPHFSATLSLQETMRHRSCELAIFQNLRELAQSSSPSRM